MNVPNKAFDCSRLTMLGLTDSTSVNCIESGHIAPFAQEAGTVTVIRHDKNLVNIGGCGGGFPRGTTERFAEDKVLQEGN